METLNTRQVGQRIRRGTLPEYSPGGQVYCGDCGRGPTDTESLRFWAKGDRMYCDCGPGLHIPRVVYPALGIEVDVS